MTFSRGEGRSADTQCYLRVMGAFAILFNFSMPSLIRRSCLLLSAAVRSACGKLSGNSRAWSEDGVKARLVPLKSTYCKVYGYAIRRKFSVSTLVQRNRMCFRAYVLTFYF